MNVLVHETQSAIWTTARWVMTKDGDNVRGSQGTNGDLTGLSDTAGSGVQGEDAAMNARGGA